MDCRRVFLPLDAGISAELIDQLFTGLGTDISKDQGIFNIIPV